MKKAPTSIGAFSIPMKTISFLAWAPDSFAALISFAPFVFHIFILCKASRVPCQYAGNAKIRVQSIKQLSSVDFQRIEIKIGA
jgi:hypothetical protein